MYLLNRDRINAARGSGLEIGGFEPAMLQHTFYYFRLGAAYERQGHDGAWVPQVPLAADRPLMLDSGECVRVKSLEEFRFGPRLLGVLGSHSELAWNGLALLHGPTIDPLYPMVADYDGEDGAPVGKPIFLSIVNHSKDRAELPYRSRIGKVMFFDVSDTYPLDVPSDSILAQTVAHRAF